MKLSTLFKSLALAAVIFGCALYLHAKMRGFHLTKVCSPTCYPFATCTNHVPAQLDQPFTFLGRGVQCFAFLGADGETVLKLFNHKTEKREKMTQLLQSAEIAATIPKLTGVFYIHLGKSENHLGTVTLYSPEGHRQQLDLDKTEFILQHKAILAKDHLDSLFQQQKIDEAITSMKQLLTTVENRSKRGIKKRDGNILENCGFLGDRAIEIDIGSYRYRSTSVNPNPHEKASIKCSLELLDWVRKNYPQHVNQCRQELLDAKLG